MKANARQIAIETLLAVDSGRHVQSALNDYVCKLDSINRHLCSDLAYGVLRNRIRLRFILSRVLKRPAGLPDYMQAAMELAVYSIFLEDKIPPYAALDETVKIVKKRFGQRLANVANGALRAVLRFGDEPRDLSWYDSDPWQARSIYYSMPRQIIDIWRRAWGDEAALNLISRSFRRPRKGLRVNPSYSEVEKFVREFAKTPGVESIGRFGFFFEPGLVPGSVFGKELDFWHRQGAFSWQAGGSQVVLDELGILDDWKNTPVWDACAGIGGKTTAMLEAGVKVILASDPVWRRISLLPCECRRLNLPLPAVVCADAAYPPLGVWDGNILVDAPCTGLGVLNRRPDIRQRWNPEIAEQIRNLQKSILDRVCHFTMPGHELCYLTCTLNPDENEHQINRLLARNPDMQLVRQWQTPNGHTWLEGMFGARLRKKGSQKRNSHKSFHISRIRVGKL